MEASCICGSCKLQAQGDPVVVLRCHCEDCRTAGAGKEYVHVAIFSADKVRLPDGIGNDPLQPSVGLARSVVFR